MHVEAGYWPSAVYLTLTYNQPSLDALNEKHKQEHNSNSIRNKLYIDSLDKREPKEYLRRVKRKLREQGREMTYAVAGEYGKEIYTHRPHYHFIIYGAKMSDEQLLFDLWGKCDFGAHKIKPFYGQANAEYIAKYIQKNLDSYYWSRKFPHKQRPFMKTGRGFAYDPAERGKHGLAYQWALDNAQQLKTKKSMTMGGMPLTIPQYYVDMIGLEYTPEDRLPNFLEKQEEWSQFLETYQQKHGKPAEPDDLEKLRIQSNRQKSLNREAKLSLKNPKLAHEMRQRNQELLQRQGELDLKAKAENQRWREYYASKKCPPNASSVWLSDKTLEINRTNGTRSVPLDQQNNSP